MAKKEEPNAEAQRSRSEEKKRRKGLAGKNVGKREAGSAKPTGAQESRLKNQRYVEEGRKNKEEAGIKASATLRELTAGEFAEMGMVERIGEALLEALVESGYVGPRKRELAQEKLRRMLRRFSMEAADAEVFLGMMRKIVEKIK